MKEEIKAEMKSSEVGVMAEVEILKGVVEHIDSSTFVFAIVPSYVAPDPIDVSPDPTVAAPSTDLAANLSWLIFSFHALHIMTFALYIIIVILD